MRITVGMYLAAALFVLTPISAPAIGAPAPQNQSEQKQLDNLYADYWRDWSKLQSQPNRDLEDSWDHEVTAMLKHYQAALLKFNPAPLSPQARVSYRMLRYELAQKLSYYGTSVYATARMLPVNQFMGHQIQFALSEAGQGRNTFKTVADYDRALKRADGYAQWTDDAIQRMKQGVAKGVVLPRVVVKRVLPQLKQYFGKPPKKPFSGYRSQTFRTLSRRPSGNA